MYEIQFVLRYKQKCETKHTRLVNHININTISNFIT